MRNAMRRGGKESQALRTLRLRSVLAGRRQWLRRRGGCFCSSTWLNRYGLCCCLQAVNGTPVLRGKAVAQLAMASLNTTVGLANDITRCCSAPPCATWRFSLGRCLGSCAGRNNGNRCCRRLDLDLQGAACCSYAYFSSTTYLRCVGSIKFDSTISL